MRANLAGGSLRPEGSQSAAATPERFQLGTMWGASTLRALPHQAVAGSDDALSRDTLGSHEILAPLGAGGMGEVYRARDSTLKREVAIKVLPQSLSADPLFRLLGTPNEDKRHVIYECGHAVFGKDLIRPSLDWLDKYLGPVQKLVAGREIILSRAAAQRCAISRSHLPNRFQLGTMWGANGIRRVRTPFPASCDSHRIPARAPAPPRARQS
jgi:hypothetical protein